MKIGIITAMESEAKYIAEELKSEYEGARSRHPRSAFYNKDLQLVRCGIGKVNAAAGTQGLIMLERPDLVISVGVAGGAKKHLEIGDIVVGSHYAYHDVWCGTGNKHGQVQGEPQIFVADRQYIHPAIGMDRVRTGLIVSGDWFVDNATKMREIEATYPDVLAVDMESCAIAQVCAHENIPFISMRVVSDIPSEGEHKKQYDGFWNDVAERSFGFIREYLRRL